MYLLELKATFLYRLFNWGKITTFKIDEEPLVHIQGVKYIENINIENISNIKIESGLFFSSLIIITNDNIIRKIPYIYRAKTDKIVQLLPVIKAFSKVKNINLKILNKFNGQEYVSYRDNLIFYKNVITKNKQFLDYKEDFEIMFSKFDFSKTFENLYKYLGNKEKIRLENNEHFMQVEPSRSEKFLKELNERQALSVIINEDNVMVVAGAGAGKTKVIETKVNYLVNKLQVDPSSILVLAFNKDAVLELQNRINCIPSVNIKTFHSLGNKILGKDVDKRLIDFVASEDKYNAFIKGLILKTLSNKPFYNLLFLYFQSFFYNIKNPYNFGSKGEYDTYIKENKLISLKGDNVKSFGEIDIANFLYLHGIPYQYEAEYKGEYERKFEYGTYHPDFYIPANENHKDIYIEFFGIDRNGKTPSYIDEKKYNESINWKRGVHQKNKTELIDLYAYNKFEGNLLRELKRKLTKLNVDCHKMLPPEERFKVLNDTEGIDKFTKLMTKFLTNYKANKHSYLLLWNSLMLKLKNLSNKLELLFTDVEDKTQINNLYYEACLIKRKQVFLKIFKSVYDQYETLLKENNKYDFSDMIVEASDKIYKCYEDKNFDYKYILVDEFQDISLGRGDFIKKLVAMHEDSKLFVVGDDWQSINRFAGSYLSLMLNFEDEFSEGGTRKSKIIKLNKVYRFNDSISEVSSKFIQENPNQIKKEIIAPPAEEPSVLVWYGEDKRSALIDIISLIYKNIQNEESDEIPSVLVLGRYNLKSDNEYHKELIDTLQYLKEYYENKLDIEYMTIHKAKGLGRDYIVILDLQQGAFPSAQSDDPILDMVMSGKDSYPNGEERRLFYVALTRAKKKVYLYSSMHPSSFLNELTEPDKKYPIFVCNQPDNYAVQKCPVCHTGLMVKPLSDNDKFYYCQNYLCKEKAPACPICNKGFLYEDKELDRVICSNEECGYLAERCSVCGGILLHRYSKSSVLIGCSNYHGKEDSLSCTNISKVMRCRNCWEEGAFLYEVYNHKSQVIERHCSNKNCRKIFR